jgi:hypothetical protein
MRLQLSRDGMNVSCVVPGMFDTEGLTMERLVFDSDVPTDDVPWFGEGGVPGSAIDLVESISS